MLEFQLIGIGTIADRIVSLPVWVAIALVFLLPALEASAFLGFIFPGEIAVILGGVVASQSRAPLWAFIVAASSGAIVGDSIGYFIGRRWGTQLLHGTLGRLPIIRRELDKNLESAEAYVRRRKGTAVFFGRFTVALRVLVPGLAGISRVHYPSFLLYNVAGGIAWGTAFTIVGYVAGASYRQAEKVAGQIGLLLLALIVLGLIVSQLIRRLSHQSRALRAFGDRLAATPVVAWVRSRFPGQVRWTLNRLDPSAPRGFWLTFSVAVGLVAVWVFGALTQDVLGHDDLALRDPQVESWVVAHRTDWLTGAMRIVTWLGSNVVLVPILATTVALLIARVRDWRRAGLLVIALAGAVGLYDIVKPIVGRSRPPAALWIGQYDGPAFPSGHATQAVAFYGMLAIVLVAGGSLRFRALLSSAAALVCLVVGASRIYLGAHWFTDVLAGYALGVAWVALVLSVSMLTTPHPGITIESPAGPDRAEFGDRRRLLPDRQRASSEGSRAAP